MQIAFSLDCCFLGQYRMFPQKLCSPEPPARFPCTITFSASCCGSCSCQGQEFLCSGFSFHTVLSLLSPSAQLWVCSLSQWEPKWKVKLHRARNQLVEPRYCVLLPESRQCFLLFPSCTIPVLPWGHSRKNGICIGIVIPKETFGSKYWSGWLLRAGGVPLARPLLTPVLPGTCCWTMWVRIFYYFKS